MNISYSWLKDYVHHELSPEEVGERLTQTGLEVERIEKYEAVKGGLAGLTIGLVTAVEKHPDADKLSVTKVSLGEGPDLQIVCGASNVRTGQKVVVAQTGDWLHPYTGEAFQIKKAKIRGIVSEGMICAEDEIGWSDLHDGIMVLDPGAPVGKKLSEFLAVFTDHVIEIGLTPNRGDAMSHIGVAWDLAAALSVIQSAPVPVHIPAVSGFAVADHSLPMEVLLDSRAGCTRFSGITISGIEVKESPDWLKNKLKVIGLRPINNIVDITNFVMHECGQPLHAYDAEKIAGKKIVVRTLEKDTLFTTLDEKTIKLRSEDLMVCSLEQDAVIPMCIAGVFGGLHSGVSDTTHAIFLEAACWNPQWIRRTATHHNLRTDAAARFERGTDPEGTPYALKRAAGLIAELAGGRVSSDLYDIYPEPVQLQKIKLTWEKLNRIAGVEIPSGLAVSILKSLSFRIVSKNEEELEVEAPSCKTDIRRSEDVIEEILRIYGYDKIPLQDALRSSISFGADTRKEELTEELSQQLAAIGFREMMNNSISNSRYHQSLCPDATHQPVQLLSYSNTGLDSLRTSMLFPAMEVIRHNHNRKLFDLKLFEFGKTYSKREGGYHEVSILALAATGNQSPESWKVKQQPVDFYYLKGVMEALFRKCGLKDYDTRPVSDPIWKQAVSWHCNGSQLAVFGLVQQQVREYFDVKGEVYYAELATGALLRQLKPTARFIPLQKFPAVRRDLALVIDKAVTFGEIERIAFSCMGGLLKEVNLFDVYADEKIGAGKKSYAVSLMLQDEQRTMTDADIDKVMEQVMHQFQTKLNAHIRN